jgi:CMP-N-acetylneuraminic acid synthetase
MKDVHEILISPSSTLKSAMEQMTRSRKGFLVVTNEHTHLLGVVSDGDIRRALLNNMLMVSPVNQIMNIDPVTSTSVDEGFKLLDQHSLAMVPVLNHERILQGVVINEEGQKKSFQVQRVGAGESANGGVLIIIPARGGSKRIHQKNLQTVGGLSLVARAIKSAKEAFDDSLIVVSTDDQQIADEARRMGAPTPWLRPAHLATDNAGTFGVVEHALSWALENQNNRFDAVVLLEPTAPLRIPRHLSEAVALLRQSGADSVVGVSRLPHIFNPEEITRINADGQLVPYLPERLMHTRKLRGEQEDLFVQNGIVYVFRPETITTKKNLYGDRVMPYVVDWEYLSDIDEPLDLIIAESKLKMQR